MFDRKKFHSWATSNDELTDWNEIFYNMVISNQLRCQKLFDPLIVFFVNDVWGVKSKFLLILTLTTVTHVYSYKNFATCFFCCHIIIILTTKLLSIISWTSSFHRGAFSILREITPGNLFKLNLHQEIGEEREKVSYHNG